MSQIFKFEEKILMMKISVPVCLNESIRLTNVGGEEGHWEKSNGPKSIKKGVFSVS